MSELVWIHHDPEVWHYGKLLPGSTTQIKGIKGVGPGTIVYNSVKKHYSCTFPGNKKPEYKYSLKDAIRFVEEEIQKRGQS